MLTLWFPSTEPGCLGDTRVGTYPGTDRSHKHTLNRVGLIAIYHGDASLPL